VQRRCWALTRNKRGEDAHATAAGSRATASCLRVGNAGERLERNQSIRVLTKSLECAFTSTSAIERVSPAPPSSG